MNKFLLATALTLSLAACGGGGGGGSSSGPAGSTSTGSSTSTQPTNTKYLTAHDGTFEYKHQVDPAKVAELEASKQYQALIAIDSDTSSFSSAGGITSIKFSPYNAIKLAYAHTMGLTGKGQVIAMLNGKRIYKHNDLDLTKIGLLDPLSSSVTKLSDMALSTTKVTELSTHKSENVAVILSEKMTLGLLALINAKDDNQGIVGVAPEANILLSSVHGEDTELAAPVRAAIKRGANILFSPMTFSTKIDSPTYLSLGQYDKKAYDGKIFTLNMVLSDVEELIKTDSISFSQAIENLRVHSSSVQGGVERYFDALKDYSKTGVYITPAMARKTKNGSFSQHVLGVLPSYIKELSKTSLTVNGVSYAEKQKPNKLHLGLQSPKIAAGCYEAASYCISASNVVEKVAEPTGSKSDNYYFSILPNGSAAAQVAGAVALVAEAFPTLRNDELVARILASANNRFDNFKQKGTVDFGNGHSTRHIC
ncbi:hypothetical protein [Polycladidibacter stylochi]|uniref:hypothetical protein n=1 Tax=Polycladidibacter stylochi TaxID=1807766 RepID=UPI000829AC5B|nr:hypothetical protein [Pseudovibrio stylochi]